MSWVQFLLHQYYLLRSSILSRHQDSPQLESLLAPEQDRKHVVSLYLTPDTNLFSILQSAVYHYNKFNLPSGHLNQSSVT